MKSKLQTIEEEEVICWRTGQSGETGFLTIKNNYGGGVRNGDRLIKRCDVCCNGFTRRIICTSRNDRVVDSRRHSLVAGICMRSYGNL